MFAAATQGRSSEAPITVVQGQTLRDLALEADELMS